MSMAIDAVKRVRTVVEGRVEVDVKRYVRVEKIPGGELEDSKVLGAGDLRVVVTSLETGKCRDPTGLASRRFFLDEVVERRERSVGMVMSLEACVGVLAVDDSHEHELALGAGLGPSHVPLGTVTLGRHRGSFDLDAAASRACRFSTV